MSIEHQNQDLKKSTLFGLAWQYASFIAQALLQLIVLAVLARLLSPEDFGVLGIAMIVVGFAALFSQLGVGPALIQRNELTPIHIRVGFSLSILLSLVLTFIIIAITPLAAAFLRNEQVIDVLYVVSLNFLFTGFGVVAESLLKRNLQFRKLMWVDVGSYVIGYALIGITLAGLDFGVWALVGATLGQSFCKSVLLLIVNPHPLTPAFSRHEMKDLLFFGGGFTLARVLNYSANQGDYFVVGRMMGPQALGIYSRAYQLMMLPAKYFSQVLTVVLFPVMAKMQDNQRQLTKTYLTGVALVALVSGPIGVLMIVTAPEIVAVVLGSKWTDTVIPLQILTIGVISRGAYKIDDALAKALGVMYRRSIRDGIYAAAVILSAFIGLRWGLAGVAVGVLGAVILNHVLALRMSVDLLKCPWSQVIRALSPAVYPSVVVGGIAIFMRSLLVAYGLPSWFILGTTAIASGISVAGLFILQPQFLGYYGSETLRRFLPLLPIRIFPRTFSQWLLARLKH